MTSPGAEKKKQQGEEAAADDEEGEEEVVLDDDVLDLVVARPPMADAAPLAPPLLRSAFSSVPPERLTAMVAALLWENRREDRRSSYASVDADAASVVDLLSRTDRERSVSDTFRGDDVGGAILEMAWKHHPAFRPVFALSADSGTGREEEAEDEDDDEGKKDDAKDEEKRSRDVTSVFLDRVRDLRSTDKRGHDHTDAALSRLWASTSPLSPSPQPAAKKDSFEWSLPFATDLVGAAAAEAAPEEKVAVSPVRVLPVARTTQIRGNIHHEGDRLPTAIKGVTVIRTDGRAPAFLTSSPSPEETATTKTFDPEKYVVMLRGISRGNQVELHFPGSSRLFHPEFEEETVKGVVVAQYASPEEPLVVEVPPSRTLVKVDLSSAEASTKDGIFLYPPGYSSGARYGKSVSVAAPDKREVVLFAPLPSASENDLVRLTDAVCPDAADVLASRGPAVFRAIYNFRQARALGCRVADLWDDRRSADLERVAPLVRRLVHENAEAWTLPPSPGPKAKERDDDVEDWLRRAVRTSRQTAKAELLAALSSSAAAPRPPDEKDKRKKRKAPTYGGDPGGGEGEEEEEEEDEDASPSTCEPCAKQPSFDCVSHSLGKMLSVRSFRGPSSTSSASKKKRKGVRSVEFAGDSPLTAFTYSEISVGNLGKGFLLDRVRPADVECLRAKRAEVRSGISAALSEAKTKEAAAEEGSEYAARLARQAVRELRKESDVRDVVRIWPVAKMSSTGVIGGTVDAETNREAIGRRIDLQEAQRDAWIVDDLFRYSALSGDDDDDKRQRPVDDNVDDLGYITAMFIDGESRAVKSAKDAVGTDLSTGVSAALSALLRPECAEWAKRNEARLVALVEVLNPPEKVRDQISGQMAALRAKEPEIRRRFSTQDFARFRDKLVDRIAEHATLVHRRRSLVFLGAVLLEAAPGVIQVREAALNSCPAPQAPLLASPREPREQTFVRCVLADMTNADGDDEELGVARMEEVRREVAAVSTPQSLSALKEDAASTTTASSRKTEEDVKWTGFLPPPREIRSSSSSSLPSSRLLLVLDVALERQAAVDPFKPLWADRTKQWIRFACCQDVLDPGFYYHRGLTEATPELARLLEESSRSPGFGTRGAGGGWARAYEVARHDADREVREDAANRLSFLRRFSGLSDEDDVAAGRRPLPPSAYVPPPREEKSRARRFDGKAADVVRRLMAANAELGDDVWLKGIVDAAASGDDEVGGGGIDTRKRKRRRAMAVGVGGGLAGGSASASMVRRRASEMWQEVADAMLDPDTRTRMWDTVLPERRALVRFVNASLRPAMRFLARKGELKMGGRSSLAEEMSAVKTEAAQADDLHPAGNVMYDLVGGVTNGMDVLAVADAGGGATKEVLDAVATYLYVLSLHRLLREADALWVRSGGEEAQQQKDVDARTRSRRVVTRTVRTLCAALERAVDFGTQDLRSVESKVEKQREKEKQRKMALQDGLGEEEKSILREYKKVRPVEEVERFIVQRLRKGQVPASASAEEEEEAEARPVVKNDDFAPSYDDDGRGEGEENDATGGYDDETFAFPDRED